MSSTEILKHAHAIRHQGIELEKDGSFAQAEAKYDEALSLYRQHSSTDDLDYANAVRYSASLKQILGKFAESAELWREATERYKVLDAPDGVVEGEKRLKEIEDADRT